MGAKSHGVGKAGGGLAGSFSARSCQHDSYHRDDGSREPSSRGISGVVIASALLLVACLSRAEDTTNYEEPGITYGREYMAQHFAERIDPFSGNLSLQFVDLSIPGNAGFDLRVIRSYNANATGTTLSPFGRGWDMHFGRVAHRADQTCQFADSQTMVLELSDGSRQTLHKSNGVASTSTADYLTSTFWKGQCAVGGGMNVFSPDGTRYEMTEADGGYWHAKRIVDRFGNTLTLTYAVNSQTGRKVVTRVLANDGRTVTFTYESGKLKKVEGGGVAWTYAVTTAADGSGSYQLTRVVPPAGGDWIFTYNENLGTLPGSYLLKQIKNPFGGLINYTFDYVSFFGILGPPPNTVVKQKRAGSDTWGYAYAPSCPGDSNDKTTVTLPDGIGQIVYEHFGYCTTGIGAETVWKIGLMNRKSSGNVQIETLNWSSQAISDEDVARPGYFLRDTQVYRPLLSQRVVTRDGLAHSTTYASFDPYGNPQAISESGNQVRTKSLTYFNSTSLWIVGLAMNETITGIGSIDRSRGSVGQLRSESRYGVTTSFNYYTDGSLWTKTDANLKVTTFSSYLFGTARTEQWPEGVTITRTVDGMGNIESQTDGEYNWRYEHDGIGRLTYVTYPINVSGQ